MEMNSNVMDTNKTADNKMELLSAFFSKQKQKTLVSKGFRHLFQHKQSHTLNMTFFCDILS